MALVVSRFGLGLVTPTRLLNSTALTAPRRVGFDCFTCALEAAIAGQGIALSWRYFVDRLGLLPSPHR